MAIQFVFLSPLALSPIPLNTLTYYQEYRYIKIIHSIPLLSATTEDLTTASDTQETTSKRVDFMLVVVLIPSAIAFSLITAIVVLALAIGIGVLLVRKRKRNRRKGQHPSLALSNPLLPSKATEL